MLRIAGVSATGGMPGTMDAIESVADRMRLEREEREREEKERDRKSTGSIQKGDQDELVESVAL